MSATTSSAPSADTRKRLSAPARARRQADQVSFDISQADAKLVSAIVKRAVATAKSLGQTMDPVSTRMDLIATHANGNPMDFAKLLAADDFNLAHDVLGIERHLDRQTGKLTNFFLPRCSARGVSQ